MDKISVLGDAAKYLKELQERVKMLEKQTATKTMASAVVVSDKETSSSSDSCSKSNQTILEIEARISNMDVLIRIQCERQDGFTVKILDEIEKLNLTVVNSSSFPFGNYIMVVTVVAQVISFRLCYLLPFLKMSVTHQIHLVNDSFSLRLDNWIPSILCRWMKNSA